VPIKTPIKAPRRLSRHQGTYQGIKTPIKASRHLSRHQDAYKGIKTPIKALRHLSRHQDAYKGIKTPIKASRHLSRHAAPITHDKLGVSRHAALISSVPIKAARPIKTPSKAYQGTLRLYGSQAAIPAAPRTRQRQCWAARGRLGHQGTLHLAMTHIHCKMLKAMTHIHCKMLQGMTHIRCFKKTL
jgi:hypothetical protein